MSMHTNDVAQQLFDNKCIILGGQMTVDNITKLNIHGAINDGSFYKFILRSFKHVKKLTISDTQATHVVLSGIDVLDIHIFKQLKEVHVHRRGAHISMMHFAKGLADLNNTFFQRPIEFILHCIVDEYTDFQKTIED
eukprot:1069069_1